MNLRSYMITYYKDTDPLFKRAAVVLATDYKAAENHFYETHNINYHTILTIRDMDKKEEEKVDLTKKMTISLTEDDVKEMVAGYIRRNTSMTTVKAENVEFEYGVKYSGPQMDRVEHGYLKECKVKC